MEPIDPYEDRSDETEKPFVRLYEAVSLENFLRYKDEVDIGLNGTLTIIHGSYSFNTKFHYDGVMDETGLDEDWLFEQALFTRNAKGDLENEMYKEEPAVMSAPYFLFADGKLPLIGTKVRMEDPVVWNTRRSEQKENALDIIMHYNEPSSRDYTLKIPKIPFLQTI